MSGSIRSSVRRSKWTSLPAIYPRSPRTKDRLVREARWDDRSKHMGTELRDRTLGVIGFGGIGRALVKLLDGFGMKQPLVFDPFVKPADAVRLGVQSVPLDKLLFESDF